MKNHEEKYYGERTIKTHGSKREMMMIDFESKFVKIIAKWKTGEYLANIA